ncbi:MAG: hypothetical protein R6V13_02010 [Anaerolineae bacterium]
MPLISVPAVYDGKKIELLETPPVKGSYRVLVTFVEPTGEAEGPPQDLPRFWSSFGAWKDSRPVEETLEDIHATRHSKTTPPNL